MEVAVAGLAPILFLIRHSQVSRLVISIAAHISGKTKWLRYNPVSLKFRFAGGCHADL